MTLLLLPQMVLHLVYIYKQLADNQWCLVVPTRNGVTLVKGLCITGKYLCVCLLDCEVEVR